MRPIELDKLVEDLILQVSEDKAGILGWAAAAHVVPFSCYYFQSDEPKRALQILWNGLHDMTAIRSTPNLDEKIVAMVPDPGDAPTAQWDIGMSAVLVLRQLLALLHKAQTVGTIIWSTLNVVLGIAGVETPSLARTFSISRRIPGIVPDCVVLEIQRLVESINTLPDSDEDLDAWKNAQIRVGEDILQQHLATIAPERRKGSGNR